MESNPGYAVDLKALLARQAEIIKTAAALHEDIIYRLSLQEPGAVPGVTPGAGLPTSSPATLAPLNTTNLRAANLGSGGLDGPQLGGGGSFKREVSPSQTSSMGGSLRRSYADHAVAAFDSYDAPVAPTRESASDGGLTTPLLEPQSPTGKDKKGVTSLRRGSTKRQAEIFPSVDKMKNQMLQKLHKPAYSVEDLYHESGFFSDLAKSDWFQNGALGVIVLNVIWIAVDTDLNKAEVLCNAPPIFQVVNNLFCIAFTCEIFIRFMAFQNKADCLRDPWFMFDFMLVLLMIWETWIEVIFYVVFHVESDDDPAMQVIRLFRLLRLTRVARLVRVLRTMPELLVMLKAISIAVKSVGAALVLLSLIIYVFAIFMTQQLADTEAGKGCFETVPMASHCLLVNGVFSEQREFLNKMLDVDMAFYAVTLVYLLLASTTVMNMLIGILCEVIAVTAKVEQEELTLHGLTSKVKEQMAMSEEGEGAKTITRADFVSMMDRPEALDDLASEGIDVLAVVDCAPMIFKDKGRIPLADFIGSLLQFRGENKATVKDVVNMRVSFARTLARFEERIDRKINDAFFHRQFSAGGISNDGESLLNSYM
jgi:voltage-gated sodium channel